MRLCVSLTDHGDSSGRDHSYYHLVWVHEEDDAGSALASSPALPPQGPPSQRGETSDTNSIDHCDQGTAVTDNTYCPRHYYCCKKYMQSININTLCI